MQTSYLSIERKKAEWALRTDFSREELLWGWIVVTF